MNKVVINKALLAKLFYNIEYLCSASGIENSLKTFKSYHYERFEDRSYVAGRFDESTNTFKVHERIDQNEYKDKIYSFDEYFKMAVRNNINSIRKHYSQIFSNAITINSDLDNELRSILNTEMKRLAKLVDSILQYPSIKLILKEEIQKLKLPELSKSSNNYSKIPTAIIPNFFYSEKFTVEVTEKLCKTLQFHELISKCTLNQFRAIFANNKNKILHSKVTTINWECNINIVQYFIQQIEITFEISNINSTKWDIASKCFTIKGKFYDFTKQGSTGKKPKVASNRNVVDEILKNALSLYKVPTSIKS